MREIVEKLLFLRKGSLQWKTTKIYSHIKIFREIEVQYYDVVFSENCFHGIFAKKTFTVKVLHTQCGK